ncbi:MAG: hypothetical protein J6P66_00635 [Bacteroidaceae bacterium]|nr:hypothetical protein [Bacteroidaceae bacterium]
MSIIGSLMSVMDPVIMPAAVNVCQLSCICGSGKILIRMTAVCIVYGDMRIPADRASITVM